MGRKRNDEKIQVVNIRMVKEPSIYSESRISCPEDAVKAIAKDMATYDREVFAVMNLKTNGQIINLNICKSSILSNAASFIAVHNHPSGSLQPSQEDRDVTRRLLECGDLLNIKMLDHIIVAGESAHVYSFREHGELDMLKSKHRDWER